VVGYHFDEMRPYRLVRHVRSMASGAGADILVVRALPLRQPPQEEEELRRAYVSIGADDYLTLYNDVDHSAVFNPLRQAIEKRAGATILIGHGACTADCVPCCAFKEDC
jgi:hypothetical protein